MSAISTRSSSAPSALASTAPKRRSRRWKQILKHGAALGVRDVVLGMAHRGRLNVLSQVLAQAAPGHLQRVQGRLVRPRRGRGLGRREVSPRRLVGSRVRRTDRPPVADGQSVAPRDLDPVVLGKVRAKQDQNDDIVERTSALPLLIHGDAAFAGQGVVAECFGLSGLKGYRTGGSLHFIINNQIGFTTDPRYSRSSPYPSDLAKMIEAPIFHVNGDDPEAVVHVANLAIEFRQSFHKPVVIDMFCFRLYGHNEGDEPAFTQPVMYKEIRAHKSTLEIYGERLIAEGVVTQADIDRPERRLGRPPRRRIRGQSDLQAEQGRLARRTLDRTEADRRRTDDERRAVPAFGVDTLRSIGGADRLPCPATSTSTRRCARFLDMPAEASSSLGRRDRLGDRRGAGARVAARRGPPGPPVRPGQRARHLHPAPFGAHRPGDRRPLHPAQPHPRRARPAARSSTRCSPRRRCSASNTATRWPSPTRWCCGRRSSATSPTARRSCSTSSSRPASASGCGCPGLVCLLPHGYDGQGPSTPRRAWSATCRAAPRTTGRSPTARRRPTTSTSCAGS